MTKLPTGKKTTIGLDPFDSVIPFEAAPISTRSEPTNEEQLRPKTPSVAATPTVTSRKLPRTAEPPEPAFLTRRQKLTVHLEAGVVNRVKNAAYWDPQLTIAKIAERGIRLALKEVEKENGGPYPQRNGELIGGRPIK